VTEFTQADFDRGYSHLIRLSKFYINAESYEEVLGILFQIFCGLSHDEIKSLHWRDIYELDSYKNPIIIVKPLKTRDYKIYLSAALREILKKYHAQRNFVVSEFLPLYLSPPKSDLRPIFARRLFEVNGYSDELSKDLKVQFKIRQTNELLKFCGFSSKDEITYGLQHINLDIEKAPLVQLSDKNFNNGDFHFQSFSSFSNFIKNSYPDSVIRENSIRLILWLSVYSGIRLTDFLKLTWNEFLYFDSSNKRIYIKNDIEFSGFNFTLPTDLGRKLLLHFVEFVFLKHLRDYTINYGPDNNVFSQNPYIAPWDGFGDRIITDEFENLFFETIEFPFNYLNHSIFVKNDLTPIIPNNLAREIRAALFHLGHGNPDDFKANSTLIMWARRIIEIKGDHKATIQILKERFYFRTKRELAKFLGLIDEKGKIEFEGKRYSNKFEEVSFDF